MSYPSFIDNSTFYHLDSSLNSEEQLLGLAENIKKVYSLSSKQYETFEELIGNYLKAGIEIFQMQTGIVSHITEDKNYIVKDVVTDLEVIHRGDVYELEGTYCREVYESQETLGFPAIGKMPDLKNHPIYINLKLEAYISAPIFVREKLYGTLNFTSLQARKYGFSEHEHDLISMMAQAIGNFLLLQEDQDNLEKLNFRMKELVGHVSHDLRNPIGGILGISDMALSRSMDREKLEGILKVIKDEAQRSLELVNTILDAAALGTGKISMSKSSFDMSTLVQQSIQTFQPLIEDKALVLELNVTDDMKVFADENRIRQLLSNLLSNAFKFADNQSVVEVSFVTKDDKLHCEISNSKEDSGNLTDEKLYKSFGYGLDIVREVLKQHGSELGFKDGNRYKVFFDLPLS